MTVLLGFGALTVDMGFNYYTRNKLQVTADASALAGAQELEFLPDQTTMVAEALDYAGKNMPAADYGEVLDEADVVAGNWDSVRSEEHTSELQSLMRISYAVFCLKKKKQHEPKHNND